MLRILKFLACFAVLSQVNCFLSPLASLLFDVPSMLPFGEVMEENKMLAAVNQIGNGDVEEMILSPFGQIQVPEQQLQQQRQSQLQQQRQQQQLARQQQQQERKREQELRQTDRMRQQEQEQRTQQQQHEQQQREQQQRDQRRQQKDQQQQQQLQYDQWEMQVDQDPQDQLDIFEKLDGRLSENEEIVQDFADLKQQMDYVRDKIIRTIQLTKSQIEDHQRQADRQIQSLMQEQQRLQQQIRQIEQQKQQQQQQQPQLQQQQQQQKQQQQPQLQQQQQLQMPEQQEDTMMLRARSPLSRLTDDLLMPRRMFQTDRMMDSMMSMPIVAMKIDTIDQISPFSLLNEISNSIMQNPLMPFGKTSAPQSCDQIHGKTIDAHRENRIRIQHTLIKQTTYRFESSTCQCQQQQQVQAALEHCSLAYSRPDQQTCRVSELNNKQQGYSSNCQALEACKAQGAQCDGVYHDGAKYYLVECKQQGQRIATRPGLGAEYIIQLRSCF